jgi:hypothetical protein
MCLVFGVLLLGSQHTCRLYITMEPPTFSAGLKRHTRATMRRSVTLLSLISLMVLSYCAHSSELLQGQLRSLNEQAASDRPARAAVTGVSGCQPCSSSSQESNKCSDQLRIKGRCCLQADQSAAASTDAVLLCAELQCGSTVSTSEGGCRHHCSAMP